MITVLRGRRQGACSYGLEDTHVQPFPGKPEGLDFYHWRGTIWGPPHGCHENRIYELKMKCDEKYPALPPHVYFVSKINIPGVNQHNGELDRNYVPFLRDWSRLYKQWLDAPAGTPDTVNLEAALLAIRK